MKRKTVLSSFLLLASLTVIPLAEFQTTVSAAPAGTPPPQLTISKVVPNGLDTLNPTLAIEGANFGAAPKVYMGVSGGSLVQLTVLSASQNFISAQLTSATSSPGTYLLVVSRGPSATPGGPTYLVTGITPGSLVKWWTGPGSFFSYYSSTFSGEEPARGAPMPVACSLSAIALYASTDKKAAADLNADTVILTIYKNNSATSMTCSATATTTLHQVVSNTCTSSPVSFNAGDTLGMEWTHSNPSFTLYTQYGVCLRSPYKECHSVREDQDRA